MKLEHTSLLWEEGVRSSYFFPVKISIPTKWHLAWPCFPVLEVETSATCVLYQSSLEASAARCLIK